MTVWVTGAEGQLGSAVVAALDAAGESVRPLSRRDLDVTRPGELERQIADFPPRAVFYCAAYTAVDKAEQEPERAYAVNGDAVAELARLMEGTDARIVLPSTDYVFSGAASRGYRPEDQVGPINVYGASKAYGERALLSAGRHLVVRTSWLYGGSTGNFVASVIEKAARQERLRVVFDQLGRPTWAEPLAGRMVALWRRKAEGIFHATGAGPAASWHDFAEAIVRYAGLSSEVVRIGTSDLDLPARRPMFSVLDCTATDAILGEEADDWRNELRRYLARRASGETAGVRSFGSTDGA